MLEDIKQVTVPITISYSYRNHLSDCLLKYAHLSPPGQKGKICVLKFLTKSEEKLLDGIFGSTLKIHYY